MAIGCVIMAAGRGTRMQSSSAKVLAEADGKPLLEHVLDALAPLEPAKTVVVVGFDRESVWARFAPRGVEFAVQEEQLGTGHAVMMAEGAFAGFDGDLLILSGDMPLVRTDTLARLIAHHRDAGAALTLATARVDDPTGLGRIVRDGDGAVVEIVEQKDIAARPDATAVEAVDETNLGVYVADPGQLFGALHRIENDNAQNEYYLPDAARILIGDGAVVDAWCGATPEEGLGVNSRDELARAEALLRARD